MDRTACRGCVWRSFGTSVVVVVVCDLHLLVHLPRVLCASSFCQLRSSRSQLRRRSSLRFFTFVSEAFSLYAAMAALSSCGVMNYLSDAATISLASVPKAASMRPLQRLIYIRGASEPQCPFEQRTNGAKQRVDPRRTLSRRGVVFTSLSTVGIMLMPKSSPAVEMDDKDFREKLLEQIDNLQQLVNKSLSDAKEAVTTKAEEAISSLNLGNDKAAENVTEAKRSVVETVKEDNLAHN